MKFFILIPGWRLLFTIAWCINKIELFREIQSDVFVNFMGQPLHHIFA